MSQVYIFHDQAGVIPGIPGMFAHCVVEVDDEGKATIREFPSVPIIESTVEPVAEPVPQEPPATETIEQPQEPVIQEEQQHDEVTQEVVPEA